MCFILIQNLKSMRIFRFIHHEDVEIFFLKLGVSQKWEKSFESSFIQFSIYKKKDGKFFQVTLY